MNRSDNTTSPFEKQLMQSAKRLREEQDNQLPLRKYPRRHHPATTWIASIAAACMGWIFGASFSAGEEQPQPELALYSQPDTVIQYRDRLVHDTIIQEIEIPVEVESASTQKSRMVYYADTQGCNVECDGIDYSMLVGM